MIFKRNHLNSYAVFGCVLITVLLYSFSIQTLANDRSLYQKALRHYDSLLKITVDETGVDYEILHKNQHAIEHYLYALSVVKLDILQKDEKLALLINAYNAFTIRLILDYWPNISSIKNIPEFPLPRRFKDRRWKLSGRLVSLNDIEHNYIELLREPMAYMALVCATRSCPKLRPSVYSGSAINMQLIDATKSYLGQEKTLRWGMKKWLLGKERPVLYISESFRWNKAAIEFSGYTLISFIEEFSPFEAKKFIAKYKEKISIIYLEYDWRLNSSAKIRNDKNY